MAARVLTSVLAIGLLVLARPSPAQPAVDSLVFTGGLVQRDALNRPWVYLVWQARAHDVLAGRTLAIYQKAGLANAPGNYERQAVVSLQPDPGSVGVLLSRGAQLGDNLAELDATVTSLFQSLIPVGVTNLPQKAALVIQGCLGDVARFNQLVFLARSHPGLGLALGLAHAQLLPGAGPMTFEVRAFDAVAGQDVAVVGRVTVDANTPLVLPAPGPPVQVPDDSAHVVIGHLNAKFRWATEAPLRRLAMLSHGFNLYRMRRPFAEAHNFHLPANNPLTTALLRSYAASQPADVSRVNVKPVLTSTNYDPATVALFVSGTNAFFTADDNRRYDPGGIAHQNGEQFYYFVTARDLLGRDGAVSKPSALVTICDRFPPDPPKGLQVENEYTFNVAQKKSNQVLRLRWAQHANAPGDVVSRYHVYRWSGVAEMIASQGNPAANRIAIVNHLDGQPVATLADSNLVNSPTVANDLGKTFWYTVRAEDDGACGGNLSGNSGPVFGVLRDREGPAPPTGLITIQCCQWAVTNDRTADVITAGLDPALAHYRLLVTRATPELEHVEAYAFDPNEPTNRLFCGSVGGGRTGGSAVSAPTDACLYFGAAGDQVALDFAFPRAALGRSPVPLFVKARASDGTGSAFAVVVDAGVPESGRVRQLSFTAGRSCRAFALVANVPGVRPDCGVHDPGSNTNGKTPISICITLTPGTKEWKLYRRVDAGPLSLIRQDLADYATTPNHQVCHDDFDLPPNPAKVWYFAQPFDEHGNGSPMVQLDPVVLVKGLKRKTLLLKPEPEGPPGTQMRLRWFCPPYGVQRFMVYLSRSGSAPAGAVSTELSEKTGEVTLGQFPAEFQYGTYLTPEVGSSFGDGAQFTVVVDVDPNLAWFVKVQPIGVDGLAGDFSNGQAFVWTESPPGGPEVPWPAHPLPPVNPGFHPNLKAVRLSFDPQYPVGVRIGDANLRQTNTAHPFVLQSHTDPLAYLYQAGGNGDRLFPVVLYRYQVANATFPTVAGDVTQVSPMMEQIAWQQAIDPQLGAVAVIHDPFIGVYPSSPLTTSIYLLDTQPVIEGARYGYLLVQFGRDREIRAVLPAGEVEVTP